MHLQMEAKKNEKKNNLRSVFISEFGEKPISAMTKHFWA